MRMIQSQSANGRAGNRSQADEPLNVPSKMRYATISAWVKEANHLSTLGIYPREIRSFEVVTVKAGKSQIGCGRFAAVRLRDDVIELERRGDKRLWQQAIFTTKTGAATDQVLKGRVHALTRRQGGCSARDGLWILAGPETSQAA